ncbi:MAG: hypothetical protein K2I64_01365 [Muribaculaceae bacterium]|nr:hypothetical protein [Muribaculaceae bacterium]
MHLIHRFILTLSALAALMLPGCSHEVSLQPAATREAPVNSIYYWKTVFSLDSAEYDFIQRHDIGQIYLRMFDVCKVKDVSHRWSVVPNATMRFQECDSAGVPDPRLSDLKFTPVVYITLDALRDMAGREDFLAELIVERVANMCSYNRLPNVGALQLDCDWTGTTEQSYFALCREVKKKIRSLCLPWKLSSTIRLHQLSRAVPPVDHGVLMVYNTGLFSDPDAINSILSLDDVRPYVGKLNSYMLPLDIAYPVYGWQLIFRHRQFAGIATGIDVTDSSVFEQETPNTYRVKWNASLRAYGLRPYDVVRNELSSYSDVISVRQLIEENLGKRPHSNILYHLDSSLLTNFSDDEIDSIY